MLYLNRNIAILGSTGSIGKQTLEVVDKMELSVKALTADKNIDLLEQQARKYNPELVAIYDAAAANDLKVKLSDTGTKVVSGMEGLIEAATIESAETIVTAVVGTVGLRPTLAALEKGKRVALANKETLVCAGEIVMRTAREHNAKIIPVDSEHSAIFQCLDQHNDSELSRILLTASGGPFLGRNIFELALVTREEALRHPNWKMGEKITIDSATMMNKGLEYIEAMHLFGVSPDQIVVLIHPESVVHSMVEFVDNSVMAQLSRADMRIPIQYALTYPDRFPSLSGPLYLDKVGTLTFEKPDLKSFVCLDLAMKTARRGGTACTVLSAANEHAVQLFLNNEVTFNAIYELTYAAVEYASFVENPTLEDILAADEEARQLVERYA